MTPEHKFKQVLFRLLDPKKAFQRIYYIDKEYISKIEYSQYMENVESIILKGENLFKKVLFSPLECYSNEEPIYQDLKDLDNSSVFLLQLRYSSKWLLLRGGKIRTFANESDIKGFTQSELPKLLDTL